MSRAGPQLIRPEARADVRTWSWPSSQHEEEQAACPGLDEVLQARTPSQHVRVPTRVSCPEAPASSASLRVRSSRDAPSGLLLADVDVRRHVGLGGALPADDAELVGLQDLA